MIPLALAVLVSCSALPTKPVGPRPGRLIVDDSPAWSPDGQTIAFHRGFASSDGPAGVYTINKWGGRPRLIVEGNYAGPRYLRFAPDGRRLVGMWGLQLVIVDLATGGLSWPMYTDNGIATPDWSPDGSTIAYGRLFLSQFPPEPPDSGGIHLFDVASGSDRALYSDSGGVWFGHFPRWTRSGREIAFLRLTSRGHSEVVVVGPDGKGGRLLVTAEPGTVLEDLRPLLNGVTGVEGLLFSVVQPGDGTYYVDLAGRSKRRYPAILGPWDMPSPDGMEFVRVMPQPGDSVGVLFIVAADDYPAAARRQLTSWEPPLGTAAVLAQTDLARHKDCSTAETCWRKYGEDDARTLVGIGSDPDSLGDLDRRGVGPRVVEWRPRPGCDRESTLHAARAAQWSRGDATRRVAAPRARLQRPPTAR